MKLNSLLCGVVCLCLVGQAKAGLLISGVLDGPLSGGEPKLVELYATSDIADLSTYGLETATNSAAAAGPETPLSGSISAGEYLYVYNADNDLPGTTPIDKLSGFLGFTPANEIHDATAGGGASFNGDDGIVLWNSGAIVDRFGTDADADDSGEEWDYQDGWAYRVSGTGPDTSFVMSNWTFSGENVLDGLTTNAEAGSDAFPTGSYAAIPEPNTIVLVLGGLLCCSIRAKR